MYAIIWNGSKGIVTYRTEADAWRAVHELLEETFGFEYDETVLAEYDVCKI